MKNNKRKGFSLIELVIIIAILAVLIAVLAPSLMTYTERSRAQKDVTTMDEVVNAVQLAMADQKCYDEMLRYSCNNNFITYSDSSGNYGQQIIDAEYWAPDGSGRATTITFNPTRKGNETYYVLETGLVNDMTYGNGSVAENRTMQGAQIDNNQCYFKNASLNGGDITGYTYNRVRQIVGDSTIATSATYANSSFTIFIRFNQKDGVTVADVNGAFNGTNLTADAPAAKGSGTTSYDKETGNPIVNTNHTPGTTQSNFNSSALQGGGSFAPDYKNDSNNTNDNSPTYNDTIPEDATYYVGVQSIYVGDYSGATNTYTDGEFPENVSDGDVFVCGDYEYKYNYYTYDPDDMGEYQWYYNPNQNGWGVRVLDSRKTSYGDIAKSINGHTTTTLQMTFAECYDMTNAPSIPHGVTNLNSTFIYCSKLTTATVIPNTVVNMDYTFCGCRNLTTVPVIPNSVNSLAGTFSMCQAITTPPVIPSGVTNVNGLFSGCSSLNKVPTIPNGITSMDFMFYNCSSLTDASYIIIPASVETMHETFYGCKSLVKCPNFSQNTKITVLEQTFEYCSSIVEAPELPVSLQKLEFTFDGCASLVSVPEIPDSVTSMRFSFSGCSSLESAPILPPKVQYLDGTFAGCISLKTYPGSADADGDFSNYIIPSKVTQLSSVFSNCDSMVTAPVIPKNVVYMPSLFRDCDKLTGTVIIHANVNTSNTYNYKECFFSTELPIELTGTSQALSKLAATTGRVPNNVTVKK